MGRKKKSWIDIAKDTGRKYPENTIGAVGRVNLTYPEGEETPFIQSIERLVNLSAYSPPENNAVAIAQIRLRYVVCDFLCRRFSIVPPFPFVDEMGRKMKASTRKYIKMLGGEATALFNLVSDVWASRPIAGYSSAAQMWEALMLESVPRVEFFESEEFSEFIKAKAIAEYRRHTQILRDREVNPWTAQHPAHHSFFSVAMPLANQTTGLKNDPYSIQSRSYKPYLSERVALAEYFSKEGKTKKLKNIS